jgi:hypothetical protein
MMMRMMMMMMMMMMMRMRRRRRTRSTRRRRMIAPYLQGQSTHQQGQEQGRRCDLSKIEQSIPKAGPEQVTVCACCEDT